MSPGRMLFPLAVAALGAGGTSPALAQTAPPYPTPGAVSVSPAPGTISASETTQISIRGRAAADVGTVTVTGSRSGRLRGTLRQHSDGQGASWVPARAFKPRETVTVRTGLPLLGARNGDYSFRIGRFPSKVTIPHVILENINPGKLDRFRSRPDLRPPLVTVDHNPKPTAPGLIFLSPKSKKDLKQAGPMIVDNRGEPVWFSPLPGIRAATDFRAQTYRGRPVLTYWEGTSRLGIGVGDLVIRDQAYRIIRRIRTPNGFRPDLHEFLITPQNTALLVAYPAVRTDLSKVGGIRNGLAIDSVIQEVDIATGLVVFEWHSLGKIALAESFTKPEKSAVLPWDYVHTNAVGLDSDGNLLMSGRSTWGVYKIDRRTGVIRWRLGGKRSDFKIGAGAHFAWQHDVRRRSDGALTIFDNSAFPPVRKHSRALALRLDEKAKTATLLSARLHPRGLLAATQGNYQELPAGNSFVGWGSQRYFTEFDRAGRVLWNARVSVGFETYRAYRLPWVGLPATLPAVAAVRRGAGMDVYASWNGATEVASWELLGGAAATALKPLRTQPRIGFETHIPAATRTAFVAVRARNAAGAVLGTSRAARVRSG